MLETQIRLPDLGQDGGDDGVDVRAERAARHAGVDTSQVERMPFDLSVPEDEGAFVNVDASGFGLLDRRLDWEALGITLPQGSDVAFRPPRCGLLPDRWQFSLECGYSAASIRERLYSLPPGIEGGPRAGLLLYTAAPDSEGTLGGLVGLGEPAEFARHIAQALDRIRLCSEHEPADGGRTIHGAACHACLFVPETSCERGNRYLDRALQTPPSSQDKREQVTGEDPYWQVMVARLAGIASFAE